MLNGYVGKLLFVNLSDKTWEVRGLDETTARNYVGGPSLGAKILYDEMPAHTDAFAPESVIGFVSGPTNGTGPLMGGRYTVVSKSPVTGGWNDANSGGNFGPKMRKAGYDAVFIKGIADAPVYILIDGGKVEIRGAGGLWGMKIEEAEQRIKAELDDQKLGIALIGPAGERLSNMAAVMNDTHRAAGRGGSGAVMGSKKLKALVCRGDADIPVYDKAGIAALNRATVDWGKNGPIAPVFKTMGEYGTPGVYKNSVLIGDAGVRNWRGSPAEITEEEIDALTAQTMDKLYKKKKFACHACSMGCGAIYEIKNGKYPIKETGRPEYETQGTFGSMMLNSDAEVVNWCNYLANDYGYDVISLGCTVAWLMECYCDGLFTPEEMGGIDLRWGNGEAIAQMTETVCKADSEIGKVLNGGSLAAARHYNRGFACLTDADGIELPQHDSRRAPGLTRTYKYDPTPGRHVKGGLGYKLTLAEMGGSVEGTGPEDAVKTSAAEITNMMGFCVLGKMGIPPKADKKILEALTGFTYSEDDWLKLGLRSFAMRHAFNLREGIYRADHRLADRMIGKPPLREGPNAGITVDVEKMADNFYRELGWRTETGIPEKDALEALGGMERVVRDLYGGGGAGPC